MVNHRRHIGLILPALFFHFWWWGVFIKYDLWHLFKEKYFMTITMIFGSIIAGMCLSVCLLSLFFCPSVFLFVFLSVTLSVCPALSMKAFYSITVKKADRVQILKVCNN